MKQVFTITKTNFTGKWVEVWVKEDVQRDVESGFDLCSKSGYLYDACDRADILDRFHNNDMSGLKIEWEKRGMNWEIVDFVINEVVNEVAERFGYDSYEQMMMNEGEIDSMAKIAVNWVCELKGEENIF